MIRIEIQYLVDDEARRVEFKQFEDWDTLIGYLWKCFYVTNMFPTTEEDIRLTATKILTKEKCLLIIEQTI